MLDSVSILSCFLEEILDCATVYRHPIRLLIPKVLADELLQLVELKPGELELSKSFLDIFEGDHGGLLLLVREEVLEVGLVLGRLSVPLPDHGLAELEKIKRA